MSKVPYELRRSRAIIYYSSVKGWAQVMWNSARRRARQAGLEFSITRKDIISRIPFDRRCPLLCIDLKIGSGKMSDGSATVDRVVNEIGYTPGNIWVISNKANRMKSSGTPEELIAIATGVRRRQNAV